MIQPDTPVAVLAGATDVGAVRDENEDSYGLWGPNEGPWDFLIAVADGVGGHAHGKQASERAIDTFIASMKQGQFRNDQAARLSLQTAMAAANKAVLEGFADVQEGKPATTFVCALGVGGLAYIAFVGDSRAYMIHAHQIFQVSTDHTWVQWQVDQGLIKPEEAATHPHRNQVLRVLGVEEESGAELVVRALSPGDVIILCSDGVTEHLPQEEILEIGQGASSAAALAQSLVGLAVAAGGSDNATAVVAGWSGAPGGAAATKHFPSPKVTQPMRLAPEPLAEAAAPKPQPQRLRTPSRAVLILAAVFVFGLGGLLGLRGHKRQAAVPAAAVAPMPATAGSMLTAPPQASPTANPGASAPAPLAQPIGKDEQIDRTENRQLPGGEGNRAGGNGNSLRSNPRQSPASGGAQSSAN
ncbi:MAG: protein phosphatase 2C domain-containing protein [Armatimonadia bacterium]